MLKSRRYCLLVPPPPKREAAWNNRDSAVTVYPGVAKSSPYLGDICHYWIRFDR
ncbi:MAG: hypothetical protein JWO67_54 [Streptosporangiaceae bacterium]|jgi:hypothetical protein|nr:hypothetical protein [Streptosporangiaceae bacterium]